MTLPWPLSALFSVFLLFYPHLQPYHRTKVVYPLLISTSIWTSFPGSQCTFRCLLPCFHLETELRGSMMVSILIPLPLYIRNEPRTWPRAALHSVPQDGTQEASFGWGLPSHWREGDKWGKWKQLSKNNENRTVYLASPLQMHRLTPPKITKTSMIYLFIYSTNIS